MLGVPGSPGAVGWVLLLAGLLAAAAGGYRFRGRLPGEPIAAAAALSLLVTAGAAPFLAWRIVDDLRYTTRLTPYDRSVAGPVQAYLQPYLLDRVPSLIPLGDTYATAVAPSVPYYAARKAFPALALQTLFPRISTSPDRAQWIVSWGVRPSAIAPVGKVVVARPAGKLYPALYVGKVLR
jgi:hypothetical protein